jgi:hypothetical protein
MSRETYGRRFFILHEWQSSISMYGGRSKLTHLTPIAPTFSLMAGGLELGGRCNVRVSYSQSRQLMVEKEKARNYTTQNGVSKL